MGLVLHQACGAPAGRNTGPYAVGRQLPQGDMLVEAGAGTGWATLIKHEATVQEAAHHCRWSGKQSHFPVTRPTPVTLPVPTLSRPEPSVSPLPQLALGIAPSPQSVGPRQAGVTPAWRQWLA